MSGYSAEYVQDSMSGYTPEQSKLRYTLDYSRSAFSMGKKVIIHLVGIVHYGTCIMYTVSHVKNKLVRLQV